MVTQSLPQSALGVIENYWKLKAADNKYIRCPYFRNPISGRDKWKLTVYSGKGSPQEIETELKILEKLENKDFSTMQESEIRDIMKKRKLGVECSGFIARVLDEWTRDLHKKPLRSLIYFNTKGLDALFSKMRPYTHINVATFIHKRNAKEIKDVGSIAPGDIIIFDGSIDHAAIITKTERGALGKLERVYYAHSVLESSGEGVKRGTLKFINADGDLMSQAWSEEPETGHTIKERGEPHIYRLHILEA